MIDIFNVKKAYLIGIKGVGMTALAGILKELGIEVVGSDTKEKFFTDKVLKRKGIKFYEGFSSENLKKEIPVDVVISSLAYLLKPNSEIKLVQKLNLPFLSYPQALAQIFNNSFGIAICGSHGKSSTTAILGKIFKDSYYDPTVLVGSEVIEWQSNSLVSKNLKQKIEFLKKNENKLDDLDWLSKNLKRLPLFIIEADEYRESFLNYFPRIIIITNIDYDHPDYFKNSKDYFNSFLKFINNLKPPKILITYENFSKLKGINYFRVKFNHQNSFPFPIAGIHFQKNLQLIFKLVEILKINKKKFLESIANYKGLKRRFEIVKESNDIYLIDDYAHHPNEVISFYNSLKINFPNHKIFFIFQPHTFTRTHFLFKDFVEVFRKIKKDKNTQVIIFKTFPSAREKDIILKIKNLRKDIDLAKKLNLPFYKDFKKLAKFLNNNINQKTIIASVGAGDVYRLLEMIKIQNIR
jgi:UDP-N-acetylmuramate--alanine ligase